MLVKIYSDTLTTILGYKCDLLDLKEVFEKPDFSEIREINSGSIGLLINKKSYNILTKFISEIVLKFNSVYHKKKEIEFSKIFIKNEVIWIPSIYIHSLNMK
jgi:hypothetical protein